MLARFEVPQSSSEPSSYDDENDGSHESDSDSSSSSQSHTTKRRRVADSGRDSLATGSGLALVQMTAMCDGNESRDDSVYAKQAQDAERVKKALKTRCCKSDCKRGLPFKLVMRMVTLFWSLSKVSQDCVLWSMQQAAAHDIYKESEEGSDSDSEESGERSHKIQWSIEGVHAWVIWCVLNLMSS